MPGVLRPSADLDWVRADAEDLDRKLREGDGILWAGDPDLELRQGVVQAQRRVQHPKTGAWLNRGDIIARRWEVWRHCEDGVDRKIGGWRMEEFDRILMDIAGMRLGAPNTTPVLDRIDAANAEMEAKASKLYRDAMGEALEHGAKLFHDTTFGPNTFRQVGGLRDDAGVGRSENGTVPQTAEQGGS